MSGNGTRKPTLSEEVIYAALQSRFKRIEDRLDDVGRVELDGVLWVLAVETFREKAREGLLPESGAQPSPQPEVNPVFAMAYHDQTGTK